MDTVKSMYWRLLGREADQGGIDVYTKAANERGWEFVYNDLRNSPEGQQDWDRRNPDRVVELEKASARANALQEQLNAVSSQLAETKLALQNEQNKPPREVIKEVERIVEKPVEVIKTVEVPVYVDADEQTVVQNWFVRLWNNLFKK